MPIYVGSNKIKKIYHGTTQIKKVYSGSQVVFSSLPSVDREITFSVARSSYSTTSANVGNYVILVGNNSYSAKTEAYNTSLVRTIPNDIAVGKRYAAGAIAGTAYAVFAGGRTSSEYSSTTEAYNSSLVYASSAAISVRSSMFSASIGNYALFGGGVSAQGRIQNTMYPISNTLVKGTNNTVGASGEGGDLASVSKFGSYAIFAGGRNDGGTLLDRVTAFKSSLTKTTATTLNSKKEASGIIVGTNALFIGETNNTVDIYTTSLVRSTGTTLPSSGIIETFKLSGDTNGYAIQRSTGYMYIYDTNLVRQDEIVNIADGSLYKKESGSTTVGKYLITIKDALSATTTGVIYS